MLTFDLCQDLYWKLPQEAYMKRTTLLWVFFSFFFLFLLSLLEQCANGSDRDSKASNAAMQGIHCARCVQLYTVVFSHRQPCTPICLKLPPSQVSEGVFWSCNVLRGSSSSASLGAGDATQLEPPNPCYNGLGLHSAAPRDPEKDQRRSY